MSLKQAGSWGLSHIYDSVCYSSVSLSNLDIVTHREIEQSRKKKQKEY